jgi:hypothetical protein
MVAPENETAEDTVTVAMFEVTTVVKPLLVFVASTV